MKFLDKFFGKGLKKDVISNMQDTQSIAPIAESVDVSKEPGKYNAEFYKSLFKQAKTLKYAHIIDQLNGRGLNAEFKVDPLDAGKTDVVKYRIPGLMEPESFIVSKGKAPASLEDLLMNPEVSEKILQKIDPEYLKSGYEREVYTKLCKLASVAEALYCETCSRFDYNERQNAFDKIVHTIDRKNRGIKDGQIHYGPSLPEIVSAQSEARDIMNVNSKRFFETLNVSVNNAILGYIAAEYGLNPTDEQVLDAIKIVYLNDADKKDNNEGVLYNHFKKMFDDVSIELNVPGNMKESIKPSAIKKLMGEKEGAKIKLNDSAIYHNLGDAIYREFKEIFPQKYDDLARLRYGSVNIFTERYWTQLEKSVMRESIKPLVSW